MLNFFFQEHHSFQDEAFEPCIQHDSTGFSFEHLHAGTKSEYDYFIFNYTIWRINGIKLPLYDFIVRGEHAEDSSTLIEKVIDIVVKRVVD